MKKFLYRLIIFLYLIPILWMVLFSVSFNDLNFSSFDSLLSDSKFLSAFKMSALLGFIQAAIVALIVPVLVFYTKYFEFLFKKQIAKISLYAYFISSIFLCISFMWFFNVLGVESSFIRIVVAHFSITFPFSFWLLFNFTYLISDDLQKVVKVYKSPSIKTYFNVFLPMLKAPILVVSIFACILSWNDYIFSEIFITDNSNQNFPIWLNKMTKEEFLWQDIMASGVLSLSPIIFLFILIAIIYEFSRNKQFNV